MSSKTPMRLAMVAAFVLMATRSFAIILMGTSDPDANTAAPTGALQDSGWQWIGTFGAFCGTPIGPSSFVTASHIGGTVGQNFRFDGQDYRTTGFTIDPASDLRVWHVCGEFARKATIDETDVATGDGLVVFGRGTQRGAVLTVDLPGGSHAAGWRWGPSDALLRWGTNTVYTLYDNTQSGGRGPLLAANFDAGQGADECALSLGDSGGPVFVHRAGGWRLAAINYAVDGPFRFSATGTDFNAALYDGAGLYYQNDAGVWVQIPPDTLGASAGFYCTRVAARRAWLDTALASAPPRARVEASDAWPPSFHEIVPVSHDPVARVIVCDADAPGRVYRLSGAPGIRIASVSMIGGKIRMVYE